MADIIDDGSSHEQDESLSTLSVDSTTYLASRKLDSLPHDQVLVKIREIEGKESEIEHVLLQNNTLMKRMIDSVKENKSKASGIKKSNTDLKKRVTELESEIEQKTHEIQSFSATDKNNNAQRLKIDQAAAAVKDLRDQLYEKDRVIDKMKVKVDHDYTAMVTEAALLRLKNNETETKVQEMGSRCETLTNSLEENQQIIDSLSEQLAKEQKGSEDYKSQLAVLSCQVSELKRYYSMERHVRKQLQAKLQVSEGHFSRSGLEGRGMEHNYGAALAASHGEQTAPPTPSSPYIDYSPSEYRHY